MNEEQKIVLLFPELATKYHVHVQYVLLECDVCGRSYGATPIDSAISESQLSCFKCAAKELNELKEKQK